MLHRSVTYPKTADPQAHVTMRLALDLPFLPSNRLVTTATDADRSKMSEYANPIFSLENNTVSPKDLILEINHI